MSPDGCGTMLVVIRRGAEQKQFFITIINNTRVKCHLNLTGPKVHALYFFIILDIEVFWKIHVNDNLSVRFSLNRLRVLYWCRILYTCTWRQSLDMFSLKSLGNDITEPFSSSRTVIDTMDAVSSPLAPFFIFLRVVLSIFSMPLANLDHDLLMKPSADYMFHILCTCIFDYLHCSKSGRWEYLNLVWTKFSSCSACQSGTVCFHIWCKDTFLYTFL